MPNSIYYARPVVLVKAKENRESVKEHFQDSFASLKDLEIESTKFGIFKVETEIS